MDYLPEYEWKEWLFASGVSKGFWENRDNRCRYMKWLGETLEFNSSKDWYRVTQKDFQAHKGGGLLASYYQNSPAMAVMDYLPDDDRKSWLFIGGVPDKFWENGDNRRQYMMWLEEQLEYKLPEDWYRITAKDFWENKGARVLKYYQGSPSVAVREYLPEYP